VTFSGTFGGNKSNEVFLKGWAKNGIKNLLKKSPCKWKKGRYEGKDEDVGERSLISDSSKKRAGAKEQSNRWIFIKITQECASENPTRRRTKRQRREFRRGIGSRGRVGKKHVARYGEAQ